MSRTVKVVPVDDEELQAASPQAPSKRSVSPWKLFRFATAFDYVVMAVGLLFAAAQGVIMPLLSIIFGDAVQATAPNVTAVEAMSEPLKWFGLIAAGILTSGTVWTWAFTWTSERQGTAMRKRYLEAVLSKDISWFDTNSPEELPTRMAAEVHIIQDALGAKCGQLMVSFSQFVAGLTIAFTRGSEGWKMTLVICSSIPVFLLAGIWLSVTVSKNTDDKQTFYAKAGACAEEVLMSMRTIASFGGEEREATRYHSQLYPAKRNGAILGTQMGMSFGLMMAAFSFVYAVAFWFGAHHMTASGAEIIMVFFSVIIGVMSLMDLGDPIVRWTAAMTAGGAMLPTIDEAPKIEGDRSDATDPGLGTIQEVTFRDVTFRYPSRPDVPILKGISLSFRRGQKIALVGESGSGKSTVVQLFERFYDPLSGTVSVNGRQLQTLPLFWWRKQIGYVGQEPVLFATTVAKNISGGDKSISDEKIESVCRQAQAWDFLDALPKKLDTFVGIGGGQMSGGQKQRIAIARALMRQPQILLLDEATSALDNESEKLVQATIDRLQADENSTLTTISVAHRLSTIRNSHVIFFLKGGVVAEQGSHQELMETQGDYFTLVKSQESASAKEEEKSADIVVKSPTESDLQPEAAGVQAPVVAQGIVVLANDSKPADKLEHTSTEALGQKNEKEIEEERLKKLKEEKYSIPWSRLLGFCKTEFILFPVAFVGCLASGAVMPLQGLILARATEVFYLFVGDALKEEINVWSLYFVVCGGLVFVGETLKWGLFSFIQECMILRMRTTAFKALLKQDIGYYDDPQNSPAGLTTTLERQTKQVAGIVGINCGNGVGSLCAIAMGLTLGFLGSWKLTAVCLALVPVVMIGISVVMMAQMGGQQQDGSYSTAGAISSEAVLNIRTVRALQAEAQSLESFGQAVDKVASKDGSCFASFKKGFAFGFGNAVSLIIYIVGFLYGAQLVDSGEITQSGMFESMYCVMFGLFGAGMAVTFGADAAKGKLASYDIFSIIDRPSKVDAVDPTGSHRSLGDGGINFENVVFHYPHRPELPVLKGLNFQVRSGQSVALVGPSGSGKSTVIQMLQRFYDPSGGTVRVGGTDLKDFDISWWRKQVSLVGQEPVLFNMSLEDNVTYGMVGASRQQVEDAARKANMDYVINGKIPWEDNVGLKGGRLSGGQKQRCAIARAIIRNPSVLLLDEATSALDSVSEREVQKALDAAKTGRTTFTIAHRLSTIQDSDKIIVIVQGVLAEEGTHEELIKLGGVYFNLAQKGSA